MPALARLLIGAMERQFDFDGRCRSAGAATTRATAVGRFLAELERAGAGDLRPEELSPEHLGAGAAERIDRIAKRASDDRSRGGVVKEHS